MEFITCSGEAVLVDTNKITEAISKAFESIIARIKEFMDNICAVVGEGFVTTLPALPAVAHWLIQGFYSFKRKFKKPACVKLSLIVFAIFTIKLCVKMLILTFESITDRIRTIYLQRPQDRGSDDSVSEIVFTLITAE